MGLTIGGIGDHYAGYLHFGRDATGPTLHGGLLYYDFDRRYYGPSAYGYGYYPYNDYHYSSCYRPRRYAAYPFYEPYWGYTHTSLYYPTPYRYRYYDIDVYYVDDERPYEEVVPRPTEEPGQASAAMATPPAAEFTPALTEAGDRTLVGEGNAAFAAGQFDDARRLYARAMLADERDGYAKFLYAIANYAVQDFEVAGRAFRRAVLTAPTLIEYPVDVRALYATPFLWQTHLTELAQYVTENPKDLSAQLLLGYLHYATGDPEQALIILEPVTASNPTDDLAAVLRDAVLRVRQGKLSGK